MHNDSVLLNKENWELISCRKTETRFIIYTQGFNTPNSNNIRRFLKNLPKVLHPPSHHIKIVRAIFNPTVDYKKLRQKILLSLSDNQLRNIFKKNDANNDDQLSKEELKKAFAYLGSIIPGIRANRVLHHADANKDGFINEGEMEEPVKYAVRVGFSVTA